MLGGPWTAVERYRTSATLDRCGKVSDVRYETALDHCGKVPDVRYFLAL
jgi:hypothetical protein